MKLLLALLLAVVMLTGCSTPTRLQLDARFKPLLVMQQNGPAAAGVYWTVGDTTFTSDIGVYLALSAVEQTGVCLHEQQHSIREFAYVGRAGEQSGVTGYRNRYATDGEFVISEEQVAYAVQIAYTAQHATVEASDVNALALFMSTHYVWPAGSRTPGAPLIGYAEAQAWIESVIAASKKS